MSPADAHYRGHGLCFPRVSGDEPVLQVQAGSQDEFSPREWGCAPVEAPIEGPDQVFPA